MVNRWKIWSPLVLAPGGLDMVFIGRFSHTFPHSPLAPPAWRGLVQEEVPVALYESIFIIHPSTSDDDVNAIIGRVREIIAKPGGNVVHVENWGRKKLAYEVKKQRKGNYVLMNYEGGSGVVQELERNFRLMDSVLKFMTIKVDPRIGLPPPPTPAVEGEAAAAPAVEDAPRYIGEAAVS